MTTPEDSGPHHADRTYRSTAGLVAGVLMLALGLWVVTDAVVNGEGRVRWIALAGLALAAPLVTAFTLRPAVVAGADRLVVRNPFRTIVLPWAAVEGLRSGYSHEIFADGRKYQLWALPVSLRQRKRAARAEARAAAEGTRPARNEPRTAAGGPSGGRSPQPAGPARAWFDQAVDDLRELVERNARRPEAQGKPQVRWAWEIVVPAVAGAVALAVLWAAG
ncbi:PH domain-containing protein [Streptomyces thermolineatus]|uniref:PH domain-containing protein n=1 Tax=Streptomyces thermolineatus TaxID=44033 RepID=A0ABP5ZYR9_9ACTN